MPADTDATKAASPTPPPGRVYEVLTAGEQLGEFTVESCLAYDILGSLYHVTSSDGSAKTLFVLPKLLSEDEAFLRHFRDFREKMVHLTHPRILALGESQNIEGRICLVAEPCDGKSIPDLLGAAGIYPTFQNPQGIVRAQPSEAARDFTPDKVQKIARDVLEALDIAHTHGVLHLNLTPSNMLLQSGGDTKVLGFGLYGSIGTQSIELLVSAGIPPVSLGPRNVRLNTADIISPEVHLKQEPDARADLYAFGMSVYWMLTGLKPGANYRPPSGIVPALNPGWDIFLARCLARERNKRYPNAKAALKDLENLSQLAGPGYADDHTNPDGMPQARRDNGKRKRLLIGAAAAALALAAAAGYMVFSGDSAPAADLVAAGSPVTRHAGASPGTINLKVTPAQAVITVAEGGARFGVGSDEVRLDARPGTYTLTIDAPDYLQRKLTVSVAEGKPFAATVNLLKEAGTLEVTTAPAASVTLVSEDGTTLAMGTSDENGKVSAQAAPGTYSLLVEKENCKPARVAGVVVRINARTERTVTVEGAPATLKLASIPTGARVTLDGSDLGVTPILLEKLKPGRELTFVFSKEGYREISRKVVLDAGENKTIEAGPLPPARGTIEYSVTLSGRAPRADELAAITVARNDDNLVDRSWSEARSLPAEVAVGHYMLRVSHPDYETYQTAFVVKDNEVTKVEAALRALPARFALVGLPPGLRYTLRINSREYEKPPAEVPADIPLQIEVEARDHVTWTGSFTARPRQELLVEPRVVRMAPPPPGRDYEVPYMNGTRLAWIPEGETRLGSSPAEAGHSVAEEPLTRAKFTRGFWMGVTEVTQEQYALILDSNPSKHRGARRPVESVSRADAVRFCKMLTRREAQAGRIPEGYEFRLPNELEWEYACRAGSTEAFSFGAAASPTNGNFVGAYPTTSRLAPASDRATSAVASYQPNAYGLFDMHGNVREWVLDPHKRHLPGGRKTDYNPQPDLSSDAFSARGGSWRTPAAEARSAYRQLEPMSASTVSDDLGFRIVLAPISF